MGSLYRIGHLTVNLTSEDDTDGQVNGIEALSLIQIVGPAVGFKGADRGGCDTQVEHQSGGFTETDLIADLCGGAE